MVLNSICIIVIYEKIKDPIKATFSEDSNITSELNKKVDIKITFPSTINQIKDDPSSQVRGISFSSRSLKVILEECGEISKEFAFKLRNLYLRKIVKFASDMCNIIAPYFLSKLMYNFAYRHCDILFSNVALPKEALIYGKTRVKEIYSLLTPGNTKALVAIYSYNGYFRVFIKCICICK